MDQQLQQYKCIIEAGYMVVSKDPALLCSVCGKGVIVALWDKKGKVGGIAHCIFPRPKWREKPSNYHATIALPLLIKNIKHLNPHAQLEALIFGGAIKVTRFKRTINLTLRKTKKLLAKFSIPVVSEDTGGTFGRKIMFNNATGEAMVFKTRNIRKTDWVYSGY